MVNASREINDYMLANAFDEGARFRNGDDPAYGFPIWDISDLYIFGA